MDRQRRAVLYHRTDFQAPDGIPRCALLRVNNVLNMNDSAEMRHFTNRLCAAIADRPQQAGHPMVEKFCALADKVSLSGRPLRAMIP